MKLHSKVFFKKKIWRRNNHSSLFHRAPKQYFSLKIIRFYEKWTYWRLFTEKPVRKTKQTELDFCYQKILFKCVSYNIICMYSFILTITVLFIFAFQIKMKCSHMLLENFFYIPYLQLCCILKTNFCNHKHLKWYFNYNLPRRLHDLP